MAAGEARMWRAATSGFNGAATDLAAAGWVRIHGDEDPVQTDADAIIIENGLVRFRLNKNTTVGGITLVFFDGSGWGTGNLRTTLIGNPTVQAIERNDASEVRVRFVATTQTGNEGECVVRVRAGEPGVSLLLEGETDGFDFNYSSGASLTALWHTADGTTSTSDGLGSDRELLPPLAHHFTALRRTGEDIEVIVAQHKDGRTIVDASSATQSFTISDPNVPPVRYDIAFINRAYGAGDGGGVDVGNGDGHIREAEDNFTVVAGTWAKATNLAASGGDVLRTDTPAASNEVTWSMNFPQVGDYYIALRGQSNTSDLTLDVGVAGTFTGTPQTVPSTALGSQSTSLTFGVFTIATAGDKTVSARISNAGTATRLDLDHLEVWAFEAATGTVPFPKNLADSLLWQTRLN